MIVFWAGWDTNWKLFVAVALGFVVLAIFYLTSRGSMPEMDWKAGATWALPWLGGLCLISYLGDYPEKSKHAGNTSTIGFGMGFVVVLALSALVYWLALKVRLPNDVVAENLERMTTEAAEEDKELGSSCTDR